MTAGLQGESMVSKVRISETTWLYDHNSQFTASLSQYISFITNANTAIAEPFQIVSYGIGGYYGVIKIYSFTFPIQMRFVICC